MRAPKTPMAVPRRSGAKHALTLEWVRHLAGVLRYERVRASGEPPSGRTDLEFAFVLVAAGCEPVFVEKAAGKLAQRPAHPASRPGLREHPHDPGRARRAGLGRGPYGGGPARPDPAVLGAPAVLRRAPPRHDPSAGPSAPSASDDRPGVVKLLQRIGRAASEPSSPPYPRAPSAPADVAPRPQTIVRETPISILPQGRRENATCVRVCVTRSGVCATVRQCGSATPVSRA